MKTHTKFKQTEIGMIPEDWEVKKVEELGKIITGKTPKTADKDNFGKDYPFITPRDMSGQKNIKNTERYLSKKGKDSVKNCLLPAKSIAVSCIGSDMGKVVMTTGESVTNQQINSVIPHSVSADFIYYSLLNISDLIRNLGKQSTAVPIMNKSQFSKLKIAIPNDLLEAECAAKILSDLDSKIELNQQMNKTLEAIGQALFNHWFIDFELPIEKGKPYRSSGGEMVDSELGEIPKGWQVRKVGEVIDIFGGTTPSTKEPKYWEGGTIHWATPKDLSELDSPILIDTERKITPQGLATISSGLLPAGTVLLSSRAPIGYTAILQVPVSINQGFIAMVCNHELPNYYVFSWVQYYMDVIKSVASGTTFEEVNKSNFRRLNILVPPSGPISKFSIIFGSLYEYILNNSFQSRTLVSVRDSLLPRLMSGQIRVR